MYVYAVFAETYDEWCGSVICDELLQLFENGDDAVTFQKERQSHYERYDGHFEVTLAVRKLRVVKHDEYISDWEAGVGDFWDKKGD